MSSTFDANAALAAADARQLAGDLAGAIRLYSRLIEGASGFWPAYANRGLALQVAGDATAARGDFRRALAIEPGAAPPLRNLVDSLQGETAASAALAARALVAIAPAAWESWLSLGGVELSAHRYRAAAHALRRATALAPDVVDSLTGLGIADDAQPRRWLERALAIGATPASLLAFARHLRERNEPHEAGRAVRRLLALAPGGIEALVEAVAIIDGARATDALYRWARRARLLAPDSVVVLNNLGMAALALGALAEAERRFADAIALQPDSAEAHFNRATPLFLLGRDAEAWSEYEWRWRVGRFEKAPGTAPRWSGEPLGERRLLVHEEQGLGDALQFARYLPMMKERHRNLVFFGHSRLANLFRASFPDIEIASQPDIPSHDVAAPLLNLPRLLDQIGRPPPAPPYLKGPAAHRIEAQDRLRVGLVWGGNPGHPRDHERSIPLAMLAPWLEIPGIAWVGLMVAPGNGDIERCGFEPKIADLAPALRDPDNAAACIAGLDLLVSVDTAYCHLAGALGLPVWTLLTWIPDWRWRLSGSTTEWYPSMRLFRQPARGAWAPVIAEVGNALRRLRRP